MEEKAAGKRGLVNEKHIWSLHILIIIFAVVYSFYDLASGEYLDFALKIIFSIIIAIIMYYFGRSFRLQIISLKNTNNELNYDLQQIKNVFNELRRSEKFITDILNSISDGIFVTDKEMNILRANRAVQLLHGSDIIGKKCYDVFYKYTVKCLNCPASKTMNSKEPSTEIITSFTRTGKEVKLEIKSFPMVCPNGNVDIAVNYIKDITEPHELQKELYLREKKLASIIDNTIDFIWSIDKNYRLTIINSQLENFYNLAFGIKLQQGMNVFDLPAENHKNLWRYYYPDVLDGNHIDTEVSYKIFNSEYTLNLAVNPIRNEYLEIIGVTCYAKDITETKKAFEELSLYKEKLEQLVEERTQRLSKTVEQLNKEIEIRELSDESLKKSEELYKDLVERAGIAILINDTDGKFLYFNKMFSGMYGYSSAEVSKLTLDAFIHKDDHESTSAYYNIEDKIAHKQNQFEFKALKKDGNYIFTEAITTLVRADGKIIAFRTYLWDITNRKMAEGLMKKAKEEAEELSKMKSQFLANVSHEIRTPMNGIIGYSEIIIHSDSLEEIHSKAKAIIKESDSLILLINEILDHTKIESGKVTLEYHTFDIFKVLEGIGETLIVQASNKGLSFILNIDENIPRYINCDELRLRQVIMNLATNSVKFTKIGFIRLSANLIESDEKYCSIHFSIEDSGIGIPAEKQKVIFDSYVQADGTTSRKFGGTGLGTTISKQLVELMGGRIGLESEPEVGSTFWFELEMEISHPSKEMIQDISLTEELSEVLAYERTTKSVKILVVEDYPPNQEVVKIHLESIGYEVDIADDGFRAIELCNGNSYSIILMDLQMPGIDGFETTRIIRESGNTNSNVPILALTANADSGTRLNCMNCKMNDLVTKPIRRNSFLKVIDKWVFVSDDKEAYEIEKAVSETTPAELPEPVVMPFNMDVALEEFGDLEIIEDVVSHFITNMEQQIPGIKQAIETGDFESIRLQAHSIKGASATLEAVPLFQSAKELEICAKEKNNEGIEENFFKLESEFIIFRDFIDKLFIKF